MVRTVLTVLCSKERRFIFPTQKKLIRQLDKTPLNLQKENTVLLFSTSVVCQYFVLLNTVDINEIAAFRGIAL